MTKTRKKWRERTGAKRDKEMSVNLKENVNKTVIRQTMQWGSDCRAVGKLIKMNKTLSVNDMLGGERVRIKGKISVERTEMRMLRWMMGIKRIEEIRSEEIRARAGLANIGEKIREG